MGIRCGLLNSDPHYVSLLVTSLLVCLMPYYCAIQCIRCTFLPSTYATKSLYVLYSEGCQPCQVQVHSESATVT
jgi:hypothetical protein